MIKKYLYRLIISLVFSCVMSTSYGQGAGGISSGLLSIPAGLSSAVETARLLNTEREDVITSEDGKPFLSSGVTTLQGFETHNSHVAFLLTEAGTFIQSEDAKPLLLWNVEIEQVIPSGDIGGGVASFSSIWYHGAELSTTISTASIFVQILSFENVGLEDAGGNTIGDATTDDDITINLAGTYEIEIGCSFRNASGANKNMVIVPGVTLATPLVVTNATNTDPIVVTSEAHGLLNGDMVRISSVGGNGAANTDAFVSNKAADTFELETLANVNIAGDGAYTSGGTIDIIFPGEIVIERVVDGTDLGRGMAVGSIALIIGDIVELYVANESDTNNFILSHVSMKIFREE